MEMLTVVLLAIRNHSFGFAELVEHDDELAALDLLNFSGKQIADSARELVANLGALAFTDALDDSLLCSENGHAAEFSEIDRILEDIADLELRVFEARFLE